MFDISSGLHKSIAEVFSLFSKKWNSHAPDSGLTGRVEKEIGWEAESAAAKALHTLASQSLNNGEIPTLRTSRLEMF